MVEATRPVASVAVNKCFHVCIKLSKASSPTSVAQVTNHRTISRLRQFNEVNVIRMTWSPNWKATFKRLGCLNEGGTACGVVVVVPAGSGEAGIAYLKASWANLNKWEELWICLWEASRTALNLRTSPEKKYGSIYNKGCCFWWWRSFFFSLEVASIKVVGSRELGSGAQSSGGQWKTKGVLRRERHSSWLQSPLAFWTLLYILKPMCAYKDSVT